MNNNNIIIIVLPNLLRILTHNYSYMLICCTVTTIIMFFVLFVPFFFFFKIMRIMVGRYDFTVISLLFCYRATPFPCFVNWWRRRWDTTLTTTCSSFRRDLSRRLDMEGL